MSLERTLERYRACLADSDTRKRKTTEITFAVNCETPIAWVHLFDLDIPRFFEDPDYNLERTLAFRIWEYENIHDDRLLSPYVPLNLGFYPEFSLLDMGAQWSAAGVPILPDDHPIRESQDLSLIPEIDFRRSGIMPLALRWYDRWHALLPDDMTPGFISWGRGCLDLAIQMRGYENLMADSYESPEFVTDLLGLITRRRCEWFAHLHAHFGLQPSPQNIADDWINSPFITAEFFKSFVLPRYLEIESFHGGIGGIHSCGNQVPFQRDILSIASLQLLEVSPWTSLDATLENTPPDMFLVVSLHPNDILLTTQPEMERRLKEIKEKCAGRRYTVATSGLTPLSPDPEQFLRQTRLWTETARTLFS